MLKRWTVQGKVKRLTKAGHEMQDTAGVRNKKDQVTRRGDTVGLQNKAGQGQGRMDTVGLQNKAG